MSHRAKLIVAFATLYVVWGSTYLGIRIGLQAHMPPALMASLRLVPAGLIMLAFARFRGTPIHVRPRELRVIATTGVLLLVGGMFMIFLAEQYIPSCLAAILVALQPLWIAGAETVLPDMDKPSALGYLGIALGFIGLGILLWPRLTLPGSGLELVGTGIAVVATFIWMVGSVYSKRHPVKVDAIVATGYEMLAAGVVTGIIGILKGEVPQLLSGRVNVLPAVGATAYLAIFGSCVAFTAFVWALRHAPASKVMTYSFVNPVVAVFLGWLILREPLDWWIVAGMAVIVAGVALTTTSPTRSAAPVAAIEAAEASAEA
ncbi:MAG TPA: EamA family transporter [Coriobacteriia bacterium]|jgi:drug/metabolite transporter (DMT)-like permease